MTIKDFIDFLYSPHRMGDFAAIVAFYETSLAELPEEDHALASATVIGALARRDWPTALTVAPLALKHTEESPEDRIHIVESLVLYKPHDQSIPEFLMKEIAVLDFGDLYEAALAAHLCYRAKCLLFLLLARADAPTQDLQIAFKEIVKAGLLLNPWNDLLTTAISALSHRVDVFEPFKDHLQHILALSKAGSGTKRRKTESLLREFMLADLTMYVGSLDQDELDS